MLANLVNVEDISVEIWVVFVCDETVRNTCQLARFVCFKDNDFKIFIFLNDV